MRLQRKSTGLYVTIDPTKAVGAGGQARIFAVAEDKALFAKVYHKPTHAQAYKLATMLANPPSDPMAAQGHAMFAWPLDLLHTVGKSEQFVGFLMRRVSEAHMVLNFYNPKTRREACPFFNYKYLLHTARNLAVAFRSVHARGYVIGDVNESNVLVTPTALVTLVDTDSFQVRDKAASVVYRSPVGKPEFTPPELQGTPFAEVDRAVEHDLFGMAVLIFQLLMEGTHPFAGVFYGSGDPPPYEVRISSGHFPYGTGCRPPYRPMPGAPDFSTLHPTIRQLLVRCFEDGHANPLARPDAQTWQTALEEAEKALVTCPANDQHRFGKHLDVCPWCERKKRLKGRDPFPPQRRTVPHTATPPASVSLRVDEIVKQLAALETSSPPGSHQSRIQQICAIVSSIAAFKVQPDNVCPVCLTDSLLAVTGGFDGTCPICRTAKLKKRRFSLDLCPICRNGRLHEQAIEHLLCPLCSQALLDEVDENRRMLGLLRDVYWICSDPNCKAKFKRRWGARVEFVDCRRDPVGAAARLRGRRLSVEAWQPRSESCWTCDNGACAARFAALADGELILARFSLDPFGVGKSTSGKKLPRESWTKFANGLLDTQGNCHCPNESCCAEFDRDATQKTLGLLSCDAEAFPWAVQWQGEKTPIDRWGFLAAGKNSFRPGVICQHCKTEFDTEQSSLKLVGTAAGAIAQFLGKSDSVENWQRLAKGLPTVSEESTLRKELAGLYELQEQETRQHRESQDRRKIELEEELRLLKQHISDSQATDSRGIYPASNSTSDTRLCKQVFRRLIELRREGVSTDEAFRRVASSFGLTIDAVRLIEAEGTYLLWPPLRS